MMATVPHVTSGSGLRKFQADGFLLGRVYKKEVDIAKLEQVKGLTLERKMMMMMMMMMIMMMTTTTTTTTTTMKFGL